ncbi:MAG: hypothetical protein ACLRSW_03945, partial [Christensenellaceae bacterium]
LHKTAYNCKRTEGRVIPLNFDSYLSDFSFAISRKTANFVCEPYKTQATLPRKRSVFEREELYNSAKKLPTTCCDFYKKILHSIHLLKNCKRIFLK